MIDFVIEDMEDFRQKWLEENETTLASLPDPISESWKRSLFLGADPETTSLPPIADWRRSLAYDTCEKSVFIEDAYQEFFSTLEYFCANSRIALVFTSQALSIYNIIGHPSILKTLAARNITKGSCLSERDAGTNALSLAQTSKTHCILRPEEHFCKLLEGFVSIAGPPQDKVDTFIMAVIPEKLDIEALIPAVDYLLASCNAVFKTEDVSLHSLLKSDIFENLLDETATTCLSTNENHLVVNISKGFPLVALQRYHLARGLTAVDFLDAINPLPSINRAHKNRGKALGTLQLDTDEYFVRKYSFPSAPSEIIYTLHKIPNHGISSHLVNANLDSFSGSGTEMKNLKQAVSTASKTMANVLISGEPGTEKTLLARVIHNLRDPSRPFVHVDCSSLEKHDIGRVLFGCLDSDRQERQGAFKQSEKGTLFIASIEQLPGVIQSKLVTTLISSLYTDMDNVSQHSLKARIIASTNADLPLLVEKEAFRPELFYLIDIIHIDSIPLRLQRNNFENILRQEMKRAALDTGLESFNLSPAALETLKNYSWPGNIHELRNLVMRLQCSDHQDTITPALLPAHVVSCTPSIPAKFPGTRVSSSKEMLREQEAAKIRTVLRRNGGNKVACAAILGISRQTLYNRMKKYGIDPDQEDGL